MKDVEAIPLVLSAQEVSIVLELVNAVHDAFGVGSLEGQGADEDHREIGFLQLLGEWMRSVGQLLQSLSGISQMDVIVWDIWGGANHSNFKAVDHDCLLDSGVENWVLELWIAADEDEQVGLVKAGDSAVHEILVSEVGLEVWSVLTDVQVFAVESVH